MLTVWFLKKLFAHKSVYLTQKLCNSCFNCSWLHNPEGISPWKQPKLIQRNKAFKLVVPTVLNLCHSATEGAYLSQKEVWKGNSALLTAFIPKPTSGPKAVSTQVYLRCDHHEETELVSFQACIWLCLLRQHPGAITCCRHSLQAQSEQMEECQVSQA